MGWRQPGLVLQFWLSIGLAGAVAEYRFHLQRKWRFDFAFPASRVAVEVQGGLFSRGRHTRGAALVKEYEKLTAAAVAGWRVLYCQPNDILTVAFANQVKQAVLFGT